MSQKHTFSEAERYAVWLQHGKRCWLCREPLELVDSSVDHVVPEALLQDPDGLAQYLELYGLPSSFDVNGFENWLPAHGRCNHRKGAKRLGGYVPEQRFIFEMLMMKAELVGKTAQSIAKRGERGNILARLLIALEGDTITNEDVASALQRRHLPAGSKDLSAQDDFIQLDTGYWIRRSEIAYEGPCTCERVACVGSSEKLHCLFSRNLSPWVIAKRLYWRCYDEAIVCHRCTSTHRRGYIGRLGYCAQPYSNQETQTDEARQ